MQQKKKVQNTVLGKNEEITCDSVVKINDIDYASCDITFEDNTAKVTIEGRGKFDGLNVCDGTKTDATASKGICPIEYGIGSTYIEKLFSEEETLHNGLIKDDTVDKNIRYAGATADVKNKVYFNCEDIDKNGVNYGEDDYDYVSSCEVWRIIGVFDTKSTDSKTEDAVARIKIVRDAVLDTTMAWDIAEDGVNYINQWGETTLVDGTTPYAGASLKQYLNDGESSYYNSLTSIAKGQISDALWYTGAVANDTASGVYEDERSDATGTGTIVNYTTTWVGKIGLINPSDFGYSGINCGDYTIYDYDNESSCGKTRNWLTASSNSYWTIASGASVSVYAWIINLVGYATNRNDVDTDFSVRPSLYLSSNVEIIGGNGGDEPYKLAN